MQTDRQIDTLLVLSLWRPLTTTPSASPELGLYDLIWQRDFEDVISEGFQDGEITLDYWGGPQMKEQEGQRDDTAAWEAGVGMGGRETRVVPPEAGRGGNRLSQASRKPLNSCE